MYDGVISTWLCFPKRGIPSAVDILKLFILFFQLCVTLKFLKIPFPVPKIPSSHYLFLGLERWESNICVDYLCVYTVWNCKHQKILAI